MFNTISSRRLLFPFILPTDRNSSEKRKSYEKKSSLDGKYDRRLFSSKPLKTVLYTNISNSRSMYFFKSESVCGISFRKLEYEASIFTYFSNVTLFHVRAPTILFVKSECRDLQCRVYIRKIIDSIFFVVSSCPCTYP